MTYFLTIETPLGNVLDLKITCCFSEEEARGFLDKLFPGSKCLNISTSKS